MNRSSLVTMYLLISVGRFRSVQICGAQRTNRLCTTPTTDCGISNARTIATFGLNSYR
jgi:hypothetical protein